MHIISHFKHVIHKVISLLAQMSTTIRPISTAKLCCVSFENLTYRLKTDVGIRGADVYDIR